MLASLTGKIREIEFSCVCVCVSAALKYSVALCQQKCKRRGTLESNYCSSNFGKNFIAYYNLFKPHELQSLICSSFAQDIIELTYCYVHTNPKTYTVQILQRFTSAQPTLTSAARSPLTSSLQSWSCHYLCSSDFSLRISKTSLIACQEVKGCIQ